MPSAKPLSKLERVPLREAWKHEAGDFTPWLAEAANLDASGQTHRSFERQADFQGVTVRLHLCHKPWHKCRSGGLRSMESVRDRLAEKMFREFEAAEPNPCAFTVAWPEESIVQQAVGRLNWGHILVPLTNLNQPERPWACEQQLRPRTTGSYVSPSPASWPTWPLAAEG